MDVFINVMLLGHILDNLLIRIWKKHRKNKIKWILNGDNEDYVGEFIEFVKKHRKKFKKV